MESKGLKFRASSMGDIMSGVAKGWSVDNSVTCKRKLVQIVRERRYVRTPNNGNKYTEKGNLSEQDAITLYTRFTGNLFKKNTERLENDFFTGELDLFEGADIRKAERTHDIKCSWDLTTFPAFFDKVDADYVYQGQVYMDLSGAKTHTVAHCLVNTPASLILADKSKLKWKHQIIDIETPEYMEACAELEKNMIFDFTEFRDKNPNYNFHLTAFPPDISFRERVVYSTIERNDDVILAMQKRCADCIEWIADNYNNIIKSQPLHSLTA